MTSLLTVGFGDYYPVAFYEKVVFIFIFLFGVTVFSLFMGDLQGMINKLKNLDHDFE